MNRLLLVALIVFLVPVSGAMACPLIDGLVDYNCDQLYRVTVTGDSIVKGVGDNRNLGGYPGRLGNRLSNGSVMNLGVSGYTSGRLFRAFKRNLNRDAAHITKERTRDLDLLIVQVGTNDYWNREPASFTVRHIKRMVKYLRNKLAEEGKTAPLIVVSTLPRTDRGYQQPFINEVNSLLLKRRGRAFPVLVRQDKIYNLSLNDDELHPTARGYKQMFRKLNRSLHRVIQRRSRKDRPDTDMDGLYDEFEADYSTSSALYDTDGDTLSDGEEAFTYGTDPTLKDTDGDTVDDNVEIDAGTDPTDGSDF